MGSQPKLLDRVRRELRLRHYAIRTEMPASPGLLALLVCDACLIEDVPAKQHAGLALEQADETQ